MKLPQYHIDILDEVIAHLDTSDPGFTGSAEIRAKLNDRDVRVYLNSWVIPQLEALRDSDVPKWMRDSAARDAGRIRSKRAQAKAVQ